MGYLVDSLKGVRITMLIAKYMINQLLFIVFLLSLVIYTAHAERVSAGNSLGSVEAPAYSGGGWSTLHQGPGNRDQARGAYLHDEYRTWTALEGVSLLIAPSISPDKNRFYQTSGLAAGQSNLHAFSVEGELLWQSQPWTDADNGVDPCAVLSNVIVDAEGDLYLGDCNQMFAFHPDGSKKWTVPLPLAADDDWQPDPDLPINALTTPVFTVEGHVWFRWRCISKRYASP